MDTSLIDEFELDWRLAGKAPQTAKDYAKYLRQLLDVHSEPTLQQARQWLLECQSHATRRKRAQAIRAFGTWASSVGYDAMPWWKSIRVPREVQRPQPTATIADYRNARELFSSAKLLGLIEVMWSCGLRRGELARLKIEDINFAESFLVVRASKTGVPRVCPLSPTARQALRRCVGRRVSGSVFDMSSNAIRLALQRAGVPACHAWRRGWAVQSLRLGISEASVRTAAGWGSGAMISRYTRALAGELALYEFAHRRNLA
jgi:integrase